MKRVFAIACILALCLTFVACGGKETTVTGIVTAVDGTVVSIMRFGGKAVGTMDDISQGMRITVTLNGKGQAVTAVVSEMSFGFQRG